MGHTLTKSINLECSAVFSLENRPHAQLPYAINERSYRGAVNLRRNWGTGFAEEKKGHVSCDFVFSDGREGDIMFAATG